MLHDVKIRKCVSHGRLRVVSVPDEDFGIESAATGLNERECRFCYHRETPTRSDLIERGYAQDVVWDLATIGESIDLTTDRARRMSGSYDETYEDKAGERVEVYECYARLDVDGDGISEWRQIIMAGPQGGQKLLDQQEWDAMLPFTDIVPDPIPHVWRGRSIYDRLRDVQRVKTVLQRKMLDNLYQTLEPMRAADMRMIENPDALFDLRLGGVVRTKGDPNAAIRDLAVPFVAKEAAPMIEAMDRVAERRVGVGEQSAGLDHDALQGQVATAVNAMQSSSGLRKEDYARNIQVGMRRLFRALLRLSVQHQDKARTIRLRGKWIKIDPSVWNADMDVTINTGLGAGNRDRDLAMLQGITQKMEMIMQVLGPANPLCGVKQYIPALQMMVEAAGVKAPERFFPDVDDAALKKMQDDAGQQKPDPHMAKAQADVQIAQEKAKAEAGLAQFRAQNDNQLAREKMGIEMQGREAEAQHKRQMEIDRANHDLQVAREKAALETQLMREKAAADIQIAREKAGQDASLKRDQLMIEMQLKREQLQAHMHSPAATDVEMPQ